MGNLVYRKGWSLHKGSCTLDRALLTRLLLFEWDKLCGGRGTVFNVVVSRFSMKLQAFRAFAFYLGQKDGVSSASQSVKRDFLTAIRYLWDLGQAKT